LQYGQKYHVFSQTIYGVLLRVEDTEFAKQLVYCILYCTVGHCFSLFIVLSFCVYCFANSVSSTRSKSPFMAMLIFASASFSIATELPSESSCFDCKKVVETKNPYWPCVGLKVNFRKVRQEAASEASNKICFYQAGKRMNPKIAVTECEDSKNSWRFPSKSQVQSRKKLFTVFNSVHELLCKRKSHELQCKRKQWFIMAGNKHLFKHCFVFAALIIIIIIIV